MVDLIYSALRAVAGLFGMELVLVDAWEAIRDFMEMGGDVLFWIAVLLVVMWVLIFERLFYLYTGHRVAVREAIDTWEARPERRSWHAHQVREYLIAEVKFQLESTLGVIKALVALCPLMGLVGTVTGMVEVFEVMSLSGSGNPRAMAAGVSKATIPTMGGMVAALSGIFISFWLNRKAVSEIELLGEHLTMDH